jgi:hypothetical protein
MGSPTTFPANLQMLVWRADSSYAIAFSNVTDKFFYSKANVAQVATESGTTTDAAWHHFVATLNRAKL